MRPQLRQIFKKYNTEFFHASPLSTKVSQIWYWLVTFKRGLILNDVCTVWKASWQECFSRKLWTLFPLTLKISDYLGQVLAVKGFLVSCSLTKIWYGACSVKNKSDGNGCCEISSLVCVQLKRKCQLGLLFRTEVNEFMLCPHYFDLSFYLKN